MDDKLRVKEKRRIFVYMVCSFVIVSLVVLFILFYNKVFVMEYVVDDISFKYHSNFNVKKKNNEMIISSKDNLAFINIWVEKADTNYLSADYSNISSNVVNELIDSHKYTFLSGECSDHMCTSLYETESDKIKIVVEFRENILVTYKFSVPSSKFDKYNSSFDIIVNSLVFDNERI